MTQAASTWIQQLKNGQIKLSPLNLSVLTTKPLVVSPLDVELEISWGSRSYRFFGVIKPNAKPLTLRLAAEQLNEVQVKFSRSRPLLIAPYLSDVKLQELLAQGISALDFCGNCAITAPNELLVYRTGNPNRFPESHAIASAYRGDSSLVARALVLKPNFESVTTLLAFIRNKSGSLTMGTISKTLQRLEEDLVVERPHRGAVRVLQMERILDGLAEQARPSTIGTQWMGKVALGVDELIQRLERVNQTGQKVIRTGAGSAQEYAVFAGEPILECYCSLEPEELLQTLKANGEETRQFPNLRLIQCADQLPYFDPRPKLAASPIQTWIELAGGEKRQQDAAKQVRTLLLAKATSINA
jgi:hypothetical protein